MKAENIIRFELLGSFSCGDAVASLKAGKKTLAFLQYLIVNHKRSISSDELIDQFWPEANSTAPANALRYMLFKVRNLLEEMFPKHKDLLLTRPGCYVWNPNVSVEFDAERFEQVCVAARQQEGDERCNTLLQALALYKGDFLSSNEMEWALVLRQYYRTLFLDACKAVLPFLHKKEQWTELLDICRHAYMIDFAVEDFTIYQMRALIALGQPEQAIERYESFRDRMMQEFEIQPSEQVAQLYTLAVGLRKQDMGTSDIFQLMCEDQAEKKAFFCTFETFQSIVSLEKRHLARSNEISTLVIVRLDFDAIPMTDARRLERTLLDGLRAGDPVARLETDTYILMLTGANEENARLVMGRIEYNFHKAYRNSKAKLIYDLAPLEGNRN